MSFLQFWLTGTILAVLLARYFLKKKGQALLYYATNQKLASPLAFGQGNVKERICNIMKTKQNNKFLTGLVTVFALVTLVACSAENNEDSKINDENSGINPQITTEKTTKNIK